MKKTATSPIGLGTVAKLLPISNREVKATSTGDGLEREYKAQYKPIRSKQRKEMDAMTKVSIEGGMKVRKLPRLAGVGLASTTETGFVGIVGLAAALDSSGMFVTAW